MKLKSCAFFLIFFYGCSTYTPKKLTIEGGNVQVGKSDPALNFQMLASISGISGNGCGLYGNSGSYEEASNDLRNKTAELGGEYVQIITITEPHLEGGCYDNQYIIRGTAFKRNGDLPSKLEEVAGEEKLTKKLRELKKLLDEKIITLSEFEKQKAKLLQSN